MSSSRTGFSTLDETRRGAGSNAYAFDEVDEETRKPTNVRIVSRGSGFDATSRVMISNAYEISEDRKVRRTAKGFRISRQEGVILLVR